MSIHIDNLKRSRKSFQLGPIDVEITGGICALVGPNGAGKTTLLETVVGLAPRYSGVARIAGHDINGGSRRLAMAALGYLPQNARVPAPLHVRQAVAYAAWLKAVPASDVPARVDAALSLVNLRDRATDRVGRLSGGQRQRVAIAQAVVHGPSALVLDEPTVGLDPHQRRNLYEILGCLKVHGVTVLISTHNMEDVVHTADRVLGLSGGVLVADRELTADSQEPGRSRRFAEVEEFLSDRLGYRA